MNTEHTNQSTAPEPFGYFKAEPFGWTDCEEGDEGAIALYDRPQAEPVARDVMMALAEEVRETCWQVGSGDATIRELDLAAIVDRHAAQIAAAESSAIKLVCDALVAIVSHSGDPTGTVAALAGWRKKAEAFTRNPAAQPPAVAVRIRELEAQLNAATHARQEAQQIAQEAIEARNRAGVEIRRPLAKRIRELEEQLATATAPTDHQIVPVEPTPEMVNAGAEGDSQFYDHAHFVWRAMLAAAPQAAPLSAALADIAAERRRQIEAEGWTPDSDDRLFSGQLATAAGYYALAAGWPHERDIGRDHKPKYWPFNRDWWKPTTARRNLVKAGALIAAEIERIDRAAQKGGAA